MLHLGGLRETFAPSTYRRFRWAQVAFLLLAINLPSTVVAQSAKRQEQADKCDVARAAYGGDPAACLVVLFNWSALDASVQAAEFYMRDRRYADSLERARKHLGDSLAGVTARRYAREEARLAAQEAKEKRTADSVRAIWRAEVHRQDSLDYAIGGDAKREARRIAEAQKGYFYMTNGFTASFAALMYPREPMKGVKTRLESSDKPVSWTAEVLSGDGWKCTIGGNTTLLAPQPTCDRHQLP